MARRRGLVLLRRMVAFGLADIAVGANDVELPPEPAELACELAAADGGAEPGRGAVTSEIGRSLAALSFEARAVVLLDLAGFGEGEVAEMLGFTVATVKPRLVHAHRTLMCVLRQSRDRGERGG
jgi:DNA-directed RNA polymerase specialized sigma24 family protein